MWYTLIVAAKFLGVAPWDLEKQPMCWVSRALIASAEEDKAKKLYEEKNR